MKKVQEVVLKKDIEIIKNHTTQITKLSKYDKILLKGNNIHIKIEEKEIPIISTKSFFTICKMSKAVPEEIVFFSLYITDIITESDYISVNEREKKIKKKIPMYEKYKESLLKILIKNGNIIAKKPDLYNKIWKLAYKYLFIFPIIILLGLLTLWINFSFVLFSFIVLMNFILIGLLFTVYYLGNKKLKEKNIQEWNLINLMIFAIVVINLISILGTFVNFIGGKIYMFLNSGRTLIVPFYLFLSFFLFGVLWLNIELNKFYEKYYEEEQSGKLLEEIEP